MCKYFISLGLWLFIFSLAGAQDLPDNVARIHYQRGDGDYAGFELHIWEDTTDEVSWENGLDIAGEDDYGVYWDVNLSEDASRVGFIVHRGDEKDPGPDMFLVLGTHGREIWLQSGSELILSAPPLAPPAENTARIHYYRPDAAYEGFELHVWEDTSETVSWEDGLDITGESSFGVYWDVGLTEDAQQLGFIIHRGDEKDPGPDMFIALDETKEAWIISRSSTIYTDQPDILATAQGDLGKAKAHWLRPDLIAWEVGDVLDTMTVQLHASPQAGLELTEETVSGDSFNLSHDPAGLPEDVLAQFPHLAGYSAFRLSESAAARAPELLRSQLAVSLSDGARVLDATGLQIPGVLDALYAKAAEDETLGVDWNARTVKLWAPTAQTVRLLIYGDAGDSLISAEEMIRDDLSGVWTAALEPHYQGGYYLFEVTVYAPAAGQIETNLVTDPCSVDLSLNSGKSRFTNLSDSAAKPPGWDALVKPGISPSDISIYELHVRDFSAFDESVPQALRGTYLAFAEQNAAGYQHLKSLSEAGLSHLHLLPTFDIATIDEDKATWQDPGDLSQFPPESPKQQAAIEAIRDADPYNWGYDPYHYNVPEGSYAANPESRVLEYRQMVQSLWDAGLYTVADVVYNHTNAAGQNDKSVLDKTVPGYYHRLNSEGFVETSTCCQNTASEHTMMRKLMVDSVLLWATEYKVDAFRFDLMGHHMVEDMLAVRNALDRLTLEEHGVDGEGIYLYGEGWNFGEVADGARGLNATQINTAGTGIGTFNDRLRDAVRGGGPFDGGRDLLANQGFATGAYYAPNEAVRADKEAQLESLLSQADLVRIGLAGNLTNYSFTNRSGESVMGSEVDYNGSPAGYTRSPQENIVYISKHDNQTFWDIAQYKLPEGTPVAERVRAHNVGMSLVMLAQGIPFFQAGDDLLRSKSLDRNSYNSGDWFNRLDWTMQDNGFGSGLPMATDNRENWQYMRPLLADSDLKPEPTDIAAAAAYFETLLELRYASPLFRLDGAEAVQKRLTFHNTGPEQVPGVIVMSLDDRKGADLDSDSELLVAVFNATDERQRVVVPELTDLTLVLHPVLAEGNDERVKRAAHFRHDGGLSVPARTTAVFTLPQN